MLLAVGFRSSGPDLLSGCSGKNSLILRWNAVRGKPPVTRAPGKDRGKETEQAFIEAATTLFAEQGYHGTSISDLAKRLGLTTASMYYYVDGKQDLLFRVLQAGMADFLPALERIYESDMQPAEKLRQAVANHVDFVLDNPVAVAVFLRERRFLPPPQRAEYAARTDRYDYLFSDIIRKVIDAGQLESSDATLLRVNVLGMINWMVEWYRPDGRLSKSQVRSFMLELASHMLPLQPVNTAESRLDRVADGRGAS